MGNSSRLVFTSLHSFWASAQSFLQKLIINIKFELYCKSTALSAAGQCLANLVVVDSSDVQWTANDSPTSAANVFLMFSCSCSGSVLVLFGSCDCGGGAVGGHIQNRCSLFFCSNILYWLPLKTDAAAVVFSFI